MKPALLALKKTLTVKHDQQQVKTDVFLLPKQFWQSGFDEFYFKEHPTKQISFAEFAKNRDNYEYVKEFNKLNGYMPTFCIRNA